MLWWCSLTVLLNGHSSCRLVFTRLPCCFYNCRSAATSMQGCHEGAATMVAIASAPVLMSLDPEADDVTTMHDSVFQVGCCLRGYGH